MYIITFYLNCNGRIDVVLQPTQMYHTGALCQIEIFIFSYTYMLIYMSNEYI